MSPDAIIFPRCSITYSDVVRVAESSINAAEAARKLGVAKCTLSIAIKRYGMGHLFKHGTRRKGPAPILTREDIESVRGMLIADAAEILGVSYNTVIAAIRREGLRHLFPNRGQAVWISVRGYAV